MWVTGYVNASSQRVYIWGAKLSRVRLQPFGRKATLLFFEIACWLSQVFITDVRLKLIDCCEFSMTALSYIHCPLIGWGHFTAGNRLLQLFIMSATWRMKMFATFVFKLLLMMCLKFYFMGPFKKWVARLQNCTFHLQLLYLM